MFSKTKVSHVSVLKLKLLHTTVSIDFIIKRDFLSGRGVFAV